MLPTRIHEEKTNPIEIISYPYITVPRNAIHDVNSDGSLKSDTKLKCRHIKLKGQDAYILPTKITEGSYGVIKYINQGTQWYIAKILTEGGSIEKEFATEYRFASRVGLAIDTATYIENEVFYQILVMKWIPWMSLDDFMGMNFLMSPYQRYRLTMSSFKCTEDSYPVHKIFHFDIKQSNFVMRSSYEVTLIDYGVSIEGHTAKTQPIMIGTPFYMAPELHGYKTVCGVNVDKFSFGMMLSELYGFTHPKYHELSPMSQFFVDKNYKRIITKSDPEFKSATPNTPIGTKEKLLTVVTDLTNFDPNKRPKFRSEERDFKRSECETRLDAAFTEVKKVPILKAIIDLVEFYELIINANKKDISEKEHKAAEKKLSEFRRALLTVDFVVPVETNEHRLNVAERSFVYSYLTHFYTNDSYRNEVEDKEPPILDRACTAGLETALPNLETDIISGKHDEPIDIIVAHVPEMQKEREKDCQRHYVMVSNKEHHRAFLASKGIPVYTPADVLKAATANCPRLADIKLSTIKSTFFSKLTTPRAENVSVAWQQKKPFCSI